LFLRSTFIVVAMSVGGGVVPIRSEEGLQESDAKATFVFHLTQFVTWPELPAGAPFKIGILGPDPFGSILARLVDGEKAAGRPVAIERSSSVASLTDCQLVYVSPGAQESVPRIAAALRGRPVLIVGESNDFLPLGGMVRLFRTPERKLRLQIDLGNVQAVGLRMSSQLLRVADVQRDRR
jgi:hypothetical protein